MDRVAGYALLAAELEGMRAVSYEQLVKSVGGESLRREVITPSGIAIVEVRVEWRDRSAGSVDIVATLYGPSTWRLERLEERITILS
jgi:hypothetical protein